MKKNVVQQSVIAKLSTVLHTCKTNKKAKTRAQNIPILNQM